MVCPPSIGGIDARESLPSCGPHLVLRVRVLVEQTSEIVGTDVDAAQAGERDDVQLAEDPVDRPALQAQLTERAPIEERSACREQFVGWSATSPRSGIVDVDRSVARDAVFVDG
jgi:hypothetical protein